MAVFMVDGLFAWIWLEIFGSLFLECYEHQKHNKHHTSRGKVFVVLFLAKKVENQNQISQNLGVFSAFSAFLTAKE